MTTYELNGPAIVGTVGTLSKLIGYTIIGGVSNTVSISGNGSAVIGGSSSSITVVGEGNVSIASSGTIGSSSIHSNNVLIGGANTSLYSSGNVCIGSSATSFHFEPSNPKLFIKDNPVVVETLSSLSSPGTISPSALSNGYIQFITTPGTYTFDTTASIRNYILDASAASFTGSPSPYFEVTFQNTTGGNIFLSAGTGQTFLNNTSPYTLSNGSVVTFTFRFTSSTTMNIETPYNNTSLSSAGGTTTLVNNGTGPNLSVKGLTSGTAIGFTSSATNITIDNTGVTSFSAGTTGFSPASPQSGAITLTGLLSIGSGGTGLTSTPTNGQLLIGNGSGYTLNNLTAGTAIGVTNNAGTITINNTGVTSITTGTGISTSSSTGSVTITNTGVTSLIAGTGISVSSATGNVTVSANSSLGTSGFCARLIADVTISTSNGIIGTSWSTSGAGRWNTGSNFNVLTGIYTVPATGLYNISFGASANSISNVISLSINGNIEFSNASQVNGGSSSSGSFTLLLTSGQTLALVSGNATTIYFRSRDSAGKFGGTWFSVVRLS